MQDQNFPRSPLLFSLGADRILGEQVARALALPLSPVEERRFEDGEQKVRPLISVRGRDAYVFSSLHGDSQDTANDKLCRLLFFIGCLKTNGARRVTAVSPYLCYMRKDRQTKEQDPITGLYVAQLLEAVGTDQVMTLEAHNLSALQNAFRRPTLHLTAHGQFAERMIEIAGDAEFCVVSPDLGGAKRAEAFRELLEAKLGRPVNKAFLEKQRSSGLVTGDLFAGDVAGRVAIIIDDLISSGTTMARAAETCRKNGAERIYLCATHALFSPGARATLASTTIDGIIVTDSVALEEGWAGAKSLTVLPIAGLLAAAISGDANIAHR
ncbi:ribose-phosphate pyrophosphokinase [Pseudorhizobium halotolerans]|uniref:ribose-phosphate diphosphokinase n=1 Tax=Pseudorhizobium halotolerans TaxID=1233081 RepID=A0ABM8PDG6_9HYPH|nr:ribose-phosphate pyrophosphokinase [Pseudorhizobium halotolerans]CAD7023666.1 ribose-phosphate pyrophosphokinase [Pseudorhizobium halotolerans]